MATIPQTQNPEVDRRVRAVFDDIRATRKTDFINNLWCTLAFDPGLLKQTWAEVKRLMVTPSTLDPLTKEGKTNHLVTGLQVPVDRVFDANA